MKEKNTKLFNKIKEARTVEEKVWLTVEYLENVYNSYNDGVFVALEFNEMKEILRIVGNELDDSNEVSLKNTTKESIIKGIIRKTSDKLEDIGDYGLTKEMLNVFKTIKERKCKVYVKEDFNKFIEVYEEMENLKDIAELLDMSLDEYLEFRENNKNNGYEEDYYDDEYYLKPGDDGYEYSISEALDNMYDK